MIRIHSLSKEGICKSSISRKNVLELFGTVNNQQSFTEKDSSKQYDHFYSQFSSNCNATNVTHGIPFQC